MGYKENAARAVARRAAERAAPRPAPRPAPAPTPTPRPTPTPTPRPTQTEAQRRAERRRLGEQRDARELAINQLFSKYGYQAVSADVSYWSDTNKTNQWGTLEQNLQRRKNIETEQVKQAEQNRLTQERLVQERARQTEQTRIAQVKKTRELAINQLFQKYSYTATQADVSYWSDTNKTNQWGTLEQNLQRRKNIETEQAKRIEQDTQTKQTQSVKDLFAKYGYTATQADIDYWQDPNKTNEIGSLEINLAKRKEKEEQRLTPAQVPETISTDDLISGDSTVIEESKINQDYLDKVKITYEKYGANAGANKEFVIGASRAAGVEPDLSLIGKTLGQVMETLGLNKSLDDLGVQEAFQIPAGMEKIAHPDLAKNYDNIIEDPTGTYLYGTPKTTAEEEIVSEAPPAFSQPTDVTPPATGGNAVDEMYDSLIGEKVTEMLESVDMDEIMTKKNEAAIEVEKSRQAIVDKQLIDAVTLEGISKDQAIPMTLIRRQQGQYTTDEYITNLKMGMDYNNKLILSKMANGQYLEAQRISKDIANDVYEIRKLQLDQLMYQEKIKEDEYDKKQTELDWERKLQFEYGYTYIPNLKVYDTIVKKYKISPANFDNFIYKEGDKMYLKNLEEEAGKAIDYQFIKKTGDQPAGIFNPTTGEFTPMDTSESKATDNNFYFTDATGASWNIKGWATDNAAKTASMQRAADEIGLITEENFEEKVATHTPGITTEMINIASANSGVSREAIMTMVKQESLGGTSTNAKNDNNYAGITFNNQEWIKRFNGTKGKARPAAEGGNYVHFATPQDGLNAMAALQADYGRVKTTAEITFPTDEDMENLTQEEHNVKIAIMRLLPTKLKDALAEKLERQKEVIFGFWQGKSFQTIADEFQGFIISPDVSAEDTDLAHSLRVHAAGTDLELKELAAAINLNKPMKAMTIVENANLAEVQGNLSEVTSARSLIQGADRVLNLLADAPVKHLGAFDGKAFKVKKWLGLSSKDAKKTQQLETAIVNLLNGIRKESLGTQVTESEIKFLEPLLSSILDQPEMIKTKMDELKVGVLLQHNEARRTGHLPIITERQLLNHNLRLQMYRESSSGTDTSIAPKNGEIKTTPDGKKWKKIEGGWEEVLDNSAKAPSNWEKVHGGWETAPSGSTMV